MIKPLHGMPLFARATDIAQEVEAAMHRVAEKWQEGDVIVIAQKIVSKVDGAVVRLAEIEPGRKARQIGSDTGRDPALVQLILDQSSEVLRATPAAIIARHPTGHVLANAGIDASNVGEGNDAVLVWPDDPDARARAIRADLGEPRPAVLIADSLGRPWRIGTVGAAIGCAGLTVLEDRRGKGRDLFGRTLQATVIAVADAVAAAAVLAMGEGDEGTPAALVRGAGRWVAQDDGPGAASGLRPVAEDMFR